MDIRRRAESRLVIRGGKIERIRLRPAIEHLVNRLFQLHRGLHELGGGNFGLLGVQTPGFAVIALAGDDKCQRAE
jgi:hypothetical protein